MLNHVVTTNSVTTTTDDLGDSTESATQTTVAGVKFAPEGATESVSARSPNLVGTASLYGKFPALDADDTVTHAASCCSGQDFPLGTWQVVGGSRGWGMGTVVPIKRTGSV